MLPVIGITCSTVSTADAPTLPRYALAHHYIDCVVRAGGLPWMLPNVSPELAPAYLDRLDGVFLTGGVDLDPWSYGEEPRPDLGLVDRDRDEFELALARIAHEARRPILAICRGVQLLNVALGGSLLQHIPAEIDDALRHEQRNARLDAISHSLEIVPETQLHAITGLGRTRVNSFHHQAIARVAEGFVVSARTLDGVVEGIEDPAHPFCLGVQWHPERRPTDALTLSLLDGFMAAAARVGSQAQGDRGPDGTTDVVQDRVAEA